MTLSQCSDLGLKHQRIIANAGSGKTYRLTTRYIELLERQVPPERIIALTFTRKAAGEFLDSIFRRLVEASSSDEAARRLARETGVPGITPARCLSHLRELIEKLPLLTLGTLDSFFVKVLWAFGFECGFAGSLRILDDHLQAVLRREVLAELFRTQLGDEKGFAELLDLIRKQNRNRESRGVSEALDREIGHLHELFLLTPEDRCWGDPSIIWPGRRLALDGGDLSLLIKKFQDDLFEIHAGMEDRHRKDWERRLQEMQALRSGSSASAQLMRFALQAVCPQPSQPRHFRLKGLSGKIFHFPDALREGVMALGRAIIHCELEGRLARSRALYELLARFETTYRAQVRDTGRLTFLDVAGLLAAASGRTWGARSLPSLSRSELNFRLDGSYDHWLLDEFQDTSRVQWQALRDLVDEVIQSDSGQRSFFYVGDTKQAIYAWRGGDPRLFEEVADFYNASGTQRIDTGESLEISFRSEREILEAINTIFSPDDLRQVAPELGFPEQTLERWRSAWRDHASHTPSRNGGCFEWRPLDVPASDKIRALDEEVARLIAEVNPLAKGLSCAVLVRSNARILTIINALRQVGIPAASEGRFFPSQDSDVVAALLALLRVVAHPADFLSLNHVRMTPLASLWADDLNKFRFAALAKIREAGFHGVLAEWLDEVRIDDKPFAEFRAQELLKASFSFDAAWQGRASVDEFVAFARAFASSEDPAARTIRVLTIHASKGLDFDMVVLPDIDTPAFAGRRDNSLHLHRSADGSVMWGLELPVKGVCLSDAVLREAWESDAAQDCYENLCLYYVAMTRAKRGLYLLSRRLSERSDCRDFNRLLSETFHGAGTILGNPRWHDKLQKRELVLEAAPISPLSGDRQADLHSLQPSQADDSLINAGSFFREISAFGTGTEVHRALAQISWLEEGLPEFASLSPAVALVIGSFLETQTARRLFTRPAKPHALWREQAFDVMLDGQWVSGVFDRVVIHYDGGEPVRAAIYDFKMKEGELPETYTEQMNLYRKSLSRLIGLPQEKITSSLIAVRTGQEIPVAGHSLVQGVFDLV